MVLEAFFMSANTSVAVSWFVGKHAMGKTAHRQSDNVAQPAELVMEGHGVD